MIHLVTGQINAGKTTYLRNLYRETGLGDGFICQKVFENNEFLRYDLLHLGSGQTKPFAIRKSQQPTNWIQAAEIGKYTISANAIKFAEKIITDAITNNISPLFIDEIGPLELNKKQGFINIINQVINSELDAYITVRDSLVDELEILIKPRISRMARIEILEPQMNADNTDKFIEINI